MKLIRILIAVFFLLSVTPMEAFCKDSHCMESPSHSAVNCCHSVNVNAEISVAQTPFMTLLSSETISPYQSTYENPVLLSLKKPPIVLS